MDNFSLFPGLIAPELNIKINIDNTNNEQEIFNVFNILNINENNYEPTIKMDNIDFKDSEAEQIIENTKKIIEEIREKYDLKKNNTNKKVSAVIIPKIFFSNENFINEPFSKYHIKSCNIFKNIFLEDIILQNYQNLFHKFNTYVSNHPNKKTIKNNITYVFNEDCPIMGSLDLLANSNELNNYINIDNNLEELSLEDNIENNREIIIGTIKRVLQHKQRFRHDLRLKPEFIKDKCDICGYDPSYSNDDTIIEHLIHIVHEYTDIQRDKITPIIMSFFENKTYKIKLPKSVAIPYILIKNSYISSYIKYYNNLNVPLKYRIYLKLNRDTLNNCKCIKDKLVNYPYEKEIKVFGQHYLNLIENIKDSIKDVNYIIKLDISKAFASVDILKLFNILIQDSYINESLSSSEIKFCYDLYNKTYLYDKTIEMTRRELYLGVPLSTIFFQIYINYILKALKEISPDVNIITFVDDILIYDNDLPNLINNYNNLLKILDSFQLTVNTSKTKIINTKKHSLIFLNRILISNNDSEESKFISNFVKENKFIISKDSLDTLMYINLDKFSFTNTEELKYVKNLIIKYSHILKANIQ